MKRIKFDFRNRSIAEQINICEQAATNLATLPAEYLQQVNVTGLQTVTTKARASHDRIAMLRAELKTEITLRKGLAREARDLTIGCVNMAAVNMNNDPVKMLAMGLDLVKLPQPVGLPAAPRHLRAVPTASEGEARLRWQRTVRECSFTIEYRLDGTEDWQRAEIKFRQTSTVSGLVSGGKYWFRVCAGNAHGQSAWSNEAPVRVK